MWVGFAVHHAVKKLAIVGAVVAGAVLSTRTGQRMAKVAGATIKGAVTEGWKAIKETKPDPAATKSENA